MGTEVESKMYLREYNSLRDLNHNDSSRSGSWTLNNENRNLKSDQYGGTFSFRPLTDEYVGYYKEQLRRTILKHESIFRNQIRELHRLYNVQRDMMNDVKRKELDKYLLSAGSSQKPGLIPFGFLSESDRKRWQTPNLPCDRPSASGGNGIQSCFDSLKETSVLSCGPHKSGLRLGDSESLQPKHNTLQKSFFDLELPENDFINNEEVGQGIFGASGTKNYPLNLNFDVTREKDRNLPFRCGLLYGSDGDALSSNVRLRSTHGLTDLNESFHLEEAYGSASVNILGTTTRPKEDIRRQDLSVTSYSGFQRLSKEFSQNPDKEKNSEAEYKQKGWSAHNLEAGRARSNGSFCLGNSSTLAQNEWHKAHEDPKFPLSEKNGTETHRKRKLFGVDISDRNNDASVIASQTLGPSPVVQFDATNSESSQVSSWKNLPGSYNQNLTTAQGNPKSNTNAFALLNKNTKTLMPGPSAVGRKFLVDSSSGSLPDFRSEFSYQKDLCIGSHWDMNKARTCHPSVGFNHAHGVSDSNSASERCAKKNSENLGSIMDVKSAEPMYAGAVPPNVYQMNLDFLQSCSQQSNRTEMRKDHSQSFVPDALSATHTHDAERVRYEVGDSISRKILGLPIYEKNTSQDLLSHNSPSKSSFVASATNGSNSIKVALLDTDLNRDPVSSKSQERPTVEGLMVEKELVNHGAGLKHHIDLNLCASEDEGQLTPSCLRTDVRIAGERNLVPPIITENESCVDHELESVERRLKTCNSSGDESMEPPEGLIKVAADALVAISSSQMPYQGNPASDQLEASLSDSLQWLADITSSYKCDIEDEVSVSLFKDVACVNDPVPNRLDQFEFMTLNLTETKVEQCSYKPWVLDNSEHEEKPLTRRPRRGQARRGRQRKDFLRDVLPSLSILSRNEVNDDLQIIEGMVRASGGTWQSSLSQRNTARSTSGRWRRRGGGTTNSRAATAAFSSETRQPKCGELGLEEISLAGWGKRTRRLPWQRCPISNNPSNK